MNSSLLLSVTKSVVLKANLKSESIIYRPIEDEFRRKQLCCLAITSVSYCCEEPINAAIAITANHVTGRKFDSKQKRIENYELPLLVFQLKTTTAENVIVSRISPVWFDINTLSETLEFSFNELLTEKPLAPRQNCIISIGVCFR
jgi:hypothetical protein